MELIISPDIVFLDEPTTGLDSATAISVVSLLKEYVALYIVIIVFITLGYIATLCMHTYEGV